MSPNRVVAVLSSLISLALAVLPVVGNFDWQSSAGVIAGIVAVLGVTNKWLDGWQKWEHDLNRADPVQLLESVPDPPRRKRRRSAVRPS